MKKNTGRRTYTLVAFGVVLGIVLVSYIYIAQLRKTVSNNMLLSMEELSLHDMESVQSCLNSSWLEMENVWKRFALYRCESVQDAQQTLDLAGDSSSFRRLYLLDENGNLYTDQYEVLGAESGHGFDQYSGSGLERIATTCYAPDDPSEARQEMLLYGISVDWSLEDIRFVELFGLTDIDVLYEQLKIDSFGGKGYSSITNRAGNYIVNADRAAGSGGRKNIYEQLASGRLGGDTSISEITERMQENEAFSLAYTDAGGVEWVIMLRPVPDTQWYFILSVPSKVFSEQSRVFILMSMAMLAFVALLIIGTVAVVDFYNQKTAVANAQAQARSEFLSNMSHEIRTPLNGLIGLNHLMKLHIGDEEKMEEYVEKSSDTAQYLLSLVNDILDMSKLQAGKVDIVCEPLYIEPLVDSVYAMQNENIKKRGVEFFLEKDIQAPCILGDEVRIKQVLMNIVGNAAKFTPAAGSITLSVRQRPEPQDRVETVITVTDTGVGMSEEFQRHIFESFSQERNRNTDSVKGTGLGMSISYLLVKAMGGQISVKSKLNEGSTFTVVLHPEIVQAEAQEAIQTWDCVLEEQEGGAEKQTALQILLAEDNELNAEILLEILTEKGYSVVHAGDGKKAVELFAASKPYYYDVILMDMQMPVLDGCQATEKIRAMHRPDAKSVLIYACTANTFQEDREKALESGMDDFLVKPVDVNIMQQKLRAGRRNSPGEMK